MADPVFGTNTALPPAPLTSNSEDAPSLFGAHFRQGTILGSVMGSNYWGERVLPSDQTPISPDEIANNLQTDGLAGYDDHFTDVRTQGMYHAIKRDILQEKADRQVIHDTSLMGNLGVGLAVGLADPVNWIPIGRAFTAAKAGASYGRVALQGAATFGGLAAAQEPILQSTQQLRDYKDAALSIGGATILGGIVGGAAVLRYSPGVTAAIDRVKANWDDWMTKPNWLEMQRDRANTAWDAINDEIANMPAGPMRVMAGPTLTPGTAGYTARIPSVAQQTRQTQAFDALKAADDRLAMWHDNSMYTTGPLEYARTVGQRMMGQVFGPGWLDPSDYLLKRTATVEGKTALQKMTEVIQLLNKNVEKNEPTLQGAASTMDQFVGGWASFRDEMWGGSLTEFAKRVTGKGDSYWTQARKAGFAGNSEDFERQIARAVVNGHVDPGGNAGITAAAQSYKKYVSDPIKELATRAGYSVPDTPRFALGHMPRQWVKDGPTGIRGADGQGTEFKNVLSRAYYNDRMAREVQEALSNGTTVTANAERGILRWSRNEANRSFRELTGVRKFEDGGFNPTNLSETNQLEARVIPLADSYLIDRGWINYNITDVANYQTRSVVPRLALAEKFKTASGNPDPTLSSLLGVLNKDGTRGGGGSISQEYVRLAHGEQPGRPGSGNAGAPAAVTVDPADPLAAGKAVDAILTEGRNVRDVLGRLYNGMAHGSGFSFDGSWQNAEQLVHAVKLYEVTRLMGNLVVNSLSDVGNILLRNGYGTFTKTMVDDMARAGLFGTSLKGMPKDELIGEAKRWGAVTEWATNASMSAHSDLLSPYQSTAFSNGMHNIGRAFSVSNLSLWWNDMMRLKAYRAGMDRILEVAETGFKDAPDYLKRSMNQLGLGEAEINRIGAAWRSQGSNLNDGFLRFGYMSKWDDQSAVQLMANALAKDNASTVVRTRVGDFNSVAKNNPLMGLIFQFQNFIFSHSLRVLTLAEQRVIAERGMGPDSLRVYGGLGMHVGLGMLSAYLMALTRDWALGEQNNGKGWRTDTLWQNPGKWMSEGIDKSGALGMLGQANMYAERLKAPGISSGLGYLLGDESHGASEAKGRWMDRDPLQVFAGPFISQMGDFVKLGVHAARYPTADDQTFTRADARTIVEASPWQNHILLRAFAFEPAQRALTEDLMGIPYQR